MNNSFQKHELGSNIKVILDVKEEYISKFINITRERFKEGYKSIYDNVKENNKLSKLLLKEFQDKLKLVPLWSEKMIEDEYNRIKVVSKCDYLDELIEALFSSYSQMFILVNKHKDDAIKIPSKNYVIHHCYIEIARALWKKPQLYYHRYDTKTRQSLNNELDILIKESIIDAIKKLIPFKELLNNYLQKSDTSLDDIGNLDEEEHDEEDEEDEDISETYEVIEKNDIEELNEEIVEEFEDDEDEVEEVEKEQDNEDEVEEIEEIQEVEEEEVQEVEKEEDNEDEVQEIEEVQEVEEEEVQNEKVEGVQEVEKKEDNEDEVQEVEKEEDNEDEVQNEKVEEVEKEEDNEDKVQEVEKEEEVQNEKIEDKDDNINDYYKIEKEELNNIKEINILDNKNKISNKKKINNNEKKIERYLGVNIGVNEFKKNKENIKRMLLHKSITNV